MVDDDAEGALRRQWLLLTLALLPLMALRRAPAPALQGRTASEGPWGRRVRQGLLALQLGGALMLLSLAGVMAVQHHHLLHVDRGFDTRHRMWLGIMIDPTRIPPMGDFIAALNQHPAILHWAFSGSRPGADSGMDRGHARGVPGTVAALIVYAIAGSTNGKPERSASRQAASIGTTTSVWKPFETM